MFDAYVTKLAFFLEQQSTQVEWPTKPKIVHDEELYFCS